MPRGLNRSDPNAGGQTYRNGSPLDTTTHNFGNPVTHGNDPTQFGNVMLDGNDPTQFGNLVTWPTPDPAHFGNDASLTPDSGFELENSSGVILLENGDILLLEVQ